MIITDTEEKSTDNLDIRPTYAPTLVAILKSPELKDEKTTSVTQTDAPKVNFYYLLQIKGDPGFRLKAPSARKGGAKAEFTSEGWVYLKKEDAEKKAKELTKGKRTVTAIRWPEPRLDKVWYGPPDEAQLAKQEIINEIKKQNNNTKAEEIRAQCGQAGLESCWLSREILPDDVEFTEKERTAYTFFKPQLDRAIEEQEEIDLRASDIKREKEDLAGTEQANEVILEGIPKKITDLQSLHKLFAQLEAPGRPCVIINRTDAQPITEKDFKSRLSSEVVLVGYDENGNPKYMPASKFWIGHAHKHILTKIVFTNGPIDESTYNLFSGFGVRPAKGNCELILKHIEEVICAGCEVSYNAFIKLLAWQIQNIGKPSRIITILKSTVQQVGKGCLASDILLKIYGNSGFSTSDIGQITTRFNDIIRGKAYIFLDEALFSGDRKAADAIKSLATCNSRGLETKGLPTVEVPVAVNFFLATNHEDAAYIEEADARYLILEVSPHRAGDVDYFNSLYQEAENGGREAFMHHLQCLDVSGFIPSRDVPKNNEAKAAMIRSSINPYDARKWLEECCETGMLMGYRKYQGFTSDLQWESWEDGVEYDNGIFFAAYKEWQKSVQSSAVRRPTPPNNFGALLSAAGLTLRIAGKRWRTLPSIEQCLKLLAEVGKKSMKNESK